MATIDNAYVLAQLQQTFGSVIKNAEEPYGLLTVTIDKNKTIDIIKWLRDNNELQFIFLTDLCGMHYPDNKGAELGVVYHLHSLVNNVRLRIKAFTSQQDATFKSLTSIYKSANWQERETFDFFGIRFEGHPNLKRILNVDDMNYHPLLKQYPLEDATREDKNDAMFGR